MQTALAENLFTWPDENPRLIGSRCGDCGTTVFPAQPRCARCGHTSTSDVPLPTRGRLVAWTTQNFVPKLPYAGDPTGKAFRPFGVGLVQLDDVVRVEGRLTESDPAKLRFGMDVELVILPFYVDEHGDEIMTFAFAPVADSAGQG